MNQTHGPAAIFQMLNAAQVTAVLSSAIQLDVFTQIKSASDAESVAQKIKCPARTTRILLEAMVVLGLATKEGSKYGLSPLSDEYLVPGKPMYMGDISGILANPMMLSGLGQLTDAIRSGGSVLKEHGETPCAPFWETFAKCSGSMSFGAAMAMDKLTGEWIEKRKHVKVLDIAAGSGIYGFTLVQKHSNVHSTELDWPNVISETKQWAKRMHIDESRVDYLEGNLFDADYGGPYDLILMSQIYHHFDPKTCQALTRKVEKSLAPGGRVLIHDFLPGAQSPGATMFSITMLAWTRQGEAYGEKDYRGWLAEAGFKNVSVHPNQGLPTSFVLAER